MNNKIKILILMAFFVLVSLFFGSTVKGFVISSSAGVVNSYYNAMTYLKNMINEHFRQVYEIQTLRKQNAELEKGAQLLSTFANQVNGILSESNSSEFKPAVTLVRVLTYANVSDYDKFWIDFKDFNKSKVYGLIYQGKTAGIVLNKDNRPLAVLQNDPSSIFSVYIGDTKIPGIANGNNTYLIVKLIPQWLNPKVGDEVYTSGMDGVFFAGVPVGKVIKVENENLYKSAIVKPFVSPNMPSFLYVVTKSH